MELFLILFEGKLFIMLSCMLKVSWIFLNRKGCFSDCFFNSRGFPLVIEERNKCICLIDIC